MMLHLLEYILFSKSYMFIENYGDRKSVIDPTSDKIGI